MDRQTHRSTDRIHRWLIMPHGFQQHQCWENSTILFLSLCFFRTRMQWICDVLWAAPWAGGVEGTPGHWNTVTSVHAVLREYSQLAAAAQGHRLAVCAPGHAKANQHPLPQLLPCCHWANECPQCIRSSLQAKNTGSGGGKNKIIMQLCRYRSESPAVKFMAEPGFTYNLNRHIRARFSPQRENLIISVCVCDMLSLEVRTDLKGLDSFSQIENGSGSTSKNELNWTFLVAAVECIMCSAI